MLIQILIGASVIFKTIVIQVLIISAAIHGLKKYGPWLGRPPYFVKTTLALVAVVLWLVLGFTLSAWAWAGVFLMLDVFQALEPALYFSIVTFTTLGYGDITLEPHFRILASFAAVDGLIIFGLSTAFLAECTHRIRSHQDKSNIES
tara:strand:+ start:2721 stop:3161 length:441 start_codon:yes stop_codon:yes gene_type:complete